MKFIIILLSVALATMTVLNSIMAANIDQTTTPATYFGVDAKNPEAVAQRQRELNHEKWTDLFGHEADIGDMDFTPDVESSKFVEGVKKVKDALKSLLSLFTKKPAPEPAAGEPTTTTPSNA